MSVDYSSGAIIGCMIIKENLPKDFRYCYPDKKFQLDLKRLGLIMTRGDNGYSGEYDHPIIGLEKLFVRNGNLCDSKILKASDLVNAHSKTKKALEELNLWDESSFGLYAYMQVS